jgi:predicted nucleic acid-binding protein
MYLVDTSVWIHALRPSGNSAIQSLLKPIIVAGDAAVTEWILLELMTGLRTAEGKDDLLERFSPVTRLPFEPLWWERSWALAARLRKHGVSANAADCFIATVAKEHHVPLIHCDADFEDMKTHAGLETVDWTVHLTKR